MSWKGRVASAQPRVRLTRSFDQRFHNYLGYALRIEGVVGEEERAFLVGVGKAAQAKHELRVEELVSGEAEMEAILTPLTWESFPADFKEVFQAFRTPGALITASMVEWCRQNLKNLKTVDIGQGLHFVQEDNPHLIGSELAQWFSGLR